jgi:hypothetical protein
LSVAAGLTALQAGAAVPSLEECRSIADSAARLACYDAATNPGAGSIPPPAARLNRHASPVAEPMRQRQGATAVPERTRDELKQRSGFESRLVQVIPLRHGYFRLELADGTAYETTIVATPPPEGAVARIRRTLVGTTYLDIKGWSPIPVRLSRRQ